MAIDNQTYMLELVEGDRTFSVSIPKMDCITAESFILQLIVILAKAGIKIPAKAIADANAAQEVAKTVAKTPEDILFQLQSLKFEDVDELRRDMLAGCMLHVTDPKTGRSAPPIPLTEQNIKANIQSITTLFKIRTEVLKHNFGFLTDAVLSVSALDPLRSSSFNTLIAPPLSPS